MTSSGRLERTRSPFSTHHDASRSRAWSVRPAIGFGRRRVRPARRRGLEQADDLGPVGAARHDDEPAHLRIRAPEADGEPLLRGELEQADQLGRLDLLVGRGRLLDRLDPLAGEVFDQCAELGVVQELVSRRVLPGGLVRVEPVEFQVEEEVVLLRHVPGQGARPAPAAGAVPGPGPSPAGRGDGQDNDQRQAAGPDEPGRMAPA